MKKLIKISLVITILCAGTFILLNTTVTTKQGRDFQVHIIKIPFYLKAIDFLDRHYNYENLVTKIISRSDIPEERVMKLFNWTYGNIKSTPAGYPIIDDHVWHIIVRGYGTADQYCDVFSTLCNYAKIDSFFDFIYTIDKKKVMPLAFVKLYGRWGIFDPHNGVYFKNKSGQFASIEDIQRGNAIVYHIAKASEDIDYMKFIPGLTYFKNIGFKRANIQSPLRRLMYELIKITAGINRHSKNNEEE